MWLPVFRKKVLPLSLERTVGEADSSRRFATAYETKVSKRDYTVSQRESTGSQSDYTVSH